MIPSASRVPTSPACIRLYCGRTWARRFSCVVARSPNGARKHQPSVSHQAAISQSSVNSRSVIGHQSALARSVVSHRSVIGRSSLSRQSVTNESALSHQSATAQSSVGHRSIASQSSLNHRAVELRHRPGINQSSVSRQPSKTAPPASLLHTQKNRKF